MTSEQEESTIECEVALGVNFYRKILIATDLLGGPILAHEELDVPLPFNHMESRCRRALALLISAIQEDVFLVPTEEGADEALEASGDISHFEEDV